ncbi:other/Haspin protein kinase [Lentinula aciculospora]|uniref:non-specific serine/threonine protein kinase n=1 Tax=Lentinula aciculospora TaxID=153920 RepID=A0A9W9DP04_9AGAR|nr:other/Haspin protein kinase [Lentinula aciculospora]
MLGTRTKQINSYGKRSQRIVNAFQSESGGKTSIFDDLPQTKLAPVASKMKKRSENAVFRPKLSPPRQRLMHKKKQLPSAQPLRQKLMRAQVGRKLSNPKATIESTPPRTPLAVYSLNTPGSPAVPSGLMRKKTRARASSALRTPLMKSHVDMVEVDIVVLDDQGQTISRERRVSKSKGVDSASPGNSSFERSDNDEGPPKPPKRLHNVNIHLIVSEDEISDDEDALPISSSPILKRMPKINKLPTHPPLPVSARPLPYVLIPSPSPELAAIFKATQKSRLSSPPFVPLIDYDLPHVVKPRKLTPIKGRSRGLFHPPSPPSPLSDSDLDLSFSDLELGVDVDQEYTPLQALSVIPEYLRPLLEECQQAETGLHEFSAFIDTFAFDPAVRGILPAKNLQFKKVGEASFSEVFGIGDVVLKVIPLRDESRESPSESQKARISECADLPAPTDAKDVLKEIIVTRAMGEVCERFVKLVKAYVVRGRYPEVLLKLWDRYALEHGSESVRPDSFGVSQTYAIIVLPNGGPDLEAYTFTSTSKRWRQACSIFWQVTKALARAEQLVSFEHRDLHLGQILIKDLPMLAGLPMQEQQLNTPARKHPKKSCMDDSSLGINVTLIDLGLARMDAGDGQGGEIIHWTPFDEEVFMGEGDYQFDIYRMMKKQNQDNWDTFTPSTNVLWLHYLLTKLLHSKKLRAPAAPRQGVLNSSSQFTERECYECLVDIEHWIAKLTKPLLASTKNTKSKKRSAAPKVSDAPPLCAGEILEYGIKKRWVKASPNL